MVALQDDVYKSLSPYFNQFIKCIQDANKEQIDAIVPLSRAKAKKRTRSGLMNDIASHNIRATFTGKSGFEVIERYAQTQIRFSSKLLIKIKQSKNNKINFIPTQLALDFLGQVEQLRLPDMPLAITNLILTYEWDKTRTNIIKVSLLCPANKNDYLYEIPVAIPFIPEFATESKTVESNETQPKRVQPKMKKSKKVNRQKGNNNDNGEQGKGTKS